MFRRNVLIGCLFLVVGIAWPTTTILRGVFRFSEVYKTAAVEHHRVSPSEQLSVVEAVEQSAASIVGGLVCGLFGIGLALGAKEGPDRDAVAAAESAET